jgi:hypothetical protein
MRKLFLLSAAATMATAFPMPVQADPPGRGPTAEVLAFCNEQVAADPSLKLGTCVSYFITSDEGYLTQYCHYLDDHGLLDQNGITFAECVVGIRAD